MKRYISSVILSCLLGICVGGCSSKEQEQPASAPLNEPETIVVEELPAAQPAEPAPVQQPATQPTPEPAKAPAQPAAPKNTSSSKTLYPGEVLTRVKNWDQKLKFLKTNFTQVTSYDGVPVSTSQGVLYYDKAKNLLRLDTVNTDGKTDQTAITDKKQILILDGQGNEVTTLSWQEWQQGQPNQALFDFGNYTALLARHNATLKEPHLLELTPKEGEKYILYLTLSEKDYFPTTIKIVADLMQTQATLFDTQKNEVLPFETFRAGGLFK